MKRNKPVDSKVRGSLPMVHPNAAAIDIGARMHVAAVGADRTVEPVRSFGTFTTNLHRLVDWFTDDRRRLIVSVMASLLSVRAHPGIRFMRRGLQQVA